MLPHRCPEGQHLPFPNSPGYAEQAQLPVHSGHQCGPGCRPLGLVLHVKDPSHHIGAVLPSDCWPTPTSTRDETNTSGDFFLMLGLRKQETNKSQMLKLLPVSILYGQDAEWGGTPPCSPQAVALGTALQLSPPAWVCGTSSSSAYSSLTLRLILFILPVVSALRWVSFPFWEWSGQQGQAAIPLCEGGSLPRCPCSTLGLLLGAGGQKPSWHPASEAQEALSWPGSPHPSSRNP